jgi:hypothetical protein
MKEKTPKTIFFKKKKRHQTIFGEGVHDDLSMSINFFVNFQNSIFDSYYG